jgi:hypothetical protein
MARWSLVFVDSHSRLTCSPGWILALWALHPDNLGLDFTQEGVSDFFFQFTHFQAPQISHGLKQSS